MRGRIPLVLAVVAVVLTACGQAPGGTAPGGGETANQPGGAARDDGPGTARLAQDDGEGAADAGADDDGEDGPGEGNLEAADVDVADAVELRTTLEKLLGHHASLAARFMRSRVAEDPDFFESAVSALSRNTDDLAAVVASVYDEDAAAAFRELWVDHTQAFFNYAAGVAEDDAAAQEEARAALDDYRESFGAFTEEATNGELPADTVSAALREHVDHLLELADAFAAEDYESAYERQRQAYAHMFPTGMALAGGLGRELPGEFPVAFDDAPAQLRSALGLLLGEHVELGVDAMRAGVDGAPDFAAAAGALEANTRDLADAIEGLLGPDAAERFATLWADHIDHLVEYTVAVAEDDDDGRQAADGGLRDYEAAFGDYLEDVTAEELEAQAVTAAMRVHDEQLMAQIEAYAEGDYAAAHDIAFETYQHVFDTAAALAGAIESTAGEELPVGGAATGAGGASGGGRR